MIHRLSTLALLLGNALAQPRGIPNNGGNLRAAVNERALQQMKNNMNMGGGGPGADEDDSDAVKPIDNNVDTGEGNGGGGRGGDGDGGGSDGSGSAGIIENLSCEPDPQKARDYVDIVGHANWGDMECYADPVNACEGGCCRFEYYFICDTGNFAPDLACVCNSLTKTPPPTSAPLTVGPTTSPPVTTNPVSTDPPVEDVLESASNITRNADPAADCFGAQRSDPDSKRLIGVFDGFF